MTDHIKSMQLYPRADRVLRDLRHIGYADDAPLSTDITARFDQLHYHGTEAIDAAIQTAGIRANDRVLEIGSGWGGCARHIASASGASVRAVELQTDYHDIGQILTNRTGLADKVSHVNADFLNVDLPAEGFDHAVSWLALFHIPSRPVYLGRIAGALRPQGMFAAEDLYLKAPPPDTEAADFAAHLFPNSLVSEAAYDADMTEAGFSYIARDDMTADWTAFTADRLQAFRANRAAYVAVHGQDGFDTIETFYDKMAGYFDRGIVGGLRFVAQKTG